MNFMQNKLRLLVFTAPARVIDHSNSYWAMFDLWYKFEIDTKCVFSYLNRDIKEELQKNHFEIETGKRKAKHFHCKKSNRVCFIRIWIYISSLNSNQFPYDKYELCCSDGNNWSNNWHTSICAEFSSPDYDASTSRLVLQTSHRKGNSNWHVDTMIIHGDITCVIYEFQNRIISLVAQLSYCDFKHSLMGG